jgi:hypothetical protein
VWTPPGMVFLAKRILWMHQMGWQLHCLYSQRMVYSTLRGLMSAGMVGWLQGMLLLPLQQRLSRPVLTS